MFLGLGTTMNMSQMAGDAHAFKAYIDGFETRWVAAIATCRQTPDKLMIDVFKPEGDWARALAMQAK